MRDNPNQNWCYASICMHVGSINIRAMFTQQDHDGSVLVVPFLTPDLRSFQCTNQLGRFQRDPSVLGPEPSMCRTGAVDCWQP